MSIMLLSGAKQAVTMSRVPAGPAPRGAQLLGVVPARICPLRVSNGGVHSTTAEPSRAGSDWLNFLPPASGNQLTCGYADPPAQPDRPPRFAAPLPRPTAKITRDSI
jgi:hypothetical protein